MKPKPAAQARDHALDVLRADAAFLRLAALRDLYARQVAQGRAAPDLLREINAAARHLDRLPSARATQ